MTFPHEKRLYALRFDQTTLGSKPKWREIGFTRELSHDDVAQFLNGEAAGPAVYVLEQSVYARVLVAACPEGGEALFQDLGKQCVNQRTGQTTPLGQEFGPADGDAGLETRYSQPRKFPGVVNVFLRGLLAKDEPFRHRYFIGVITEIWDKLADRAGVVAIEDPVWAELRRLYRGASTIADRVRQDAFEAGKSTLPTLITGETGTGKSLLAEGIHVASDRKGPFIPINCSALAPTVEAELFGYEKGAFTGATQAKAGRFEQAHRGTLFLDEIGFLPLDQQAKFLRILEEGKVVRMGSTVPIPVDVKIVAATAGNLAAKIAAGEFLPELIARLNGVRIRIPALRDRRADIPDLVEVFWPGAVTRGYLPAALLEILKQYDWPLNVRQLEKVVIRLKERAARGSEPTREFLLERLEEDEELVPSRARSYPSPSVPSGTATEVLDAYDAARPRYERFEHVFRTVVERVVHDVVPYARVHSHTMTRAELADRLHDPDGEGSPTSAEAETHRCAVWVTVHVPNEKRDVYLELKHYFELQGDTSPEGDEDFTSAKMRPWSYVARIDGRGARRLVRLGVAPSSDLMGIVGRLELRTEIEGLKVTLEEQFAAAGVPMPPSWKAKLRGQQGPLSMVQQVLERLHQQFRSLTGSYGTYVTDEQARRKLAAHQRTLATAPDVEVAARAGKLAIVLGEWQLAIEILTPYASTKHARILRDLGAALCKRHEPHSREYQGGLAYLTQATRRARHDPDAFARLAGALRRSGDVKGACRNYERALEVDPANPYALSGLIHTTLMLDGDADVIVRMKDAIEAATARCRDRVAASVDMPWSLLDLGKFLLLAGNVREGLEAYARAVGRTTAPWMLATTMRSLQELGRFASVPSELAVAERILALGSAARFRSEDAAPRLTSRAQSRRDVHGPVVMVHEAGEGPQEDRRSALAELMATGLAGFRGTLLAVGDSGWAASMLGGGKTAAPLVRGVRTIAYASRVAPDPLLAPSLVSSSSPVEGLDAWADVVASRVPAEQVLTVIFGEHAHVPVERELALAIGARVVVVPVDDDAETTWGDDEGGPIQVVRDGESLARLVSALA